MTAAYCRTGRSRRRHGLKTARIFNPLGYASTSLDQAAAISTSSAISLGTVDECCGIMSTRKLDRLIAIGLPLRSIIHPRRGGTGSAGRGCFPTSAGSAGFRRPRASSTVRPTGRRQQPGHRRSAMRREKVSDWWTEVKRRSIFIDRASNGRCGTRKRPQLGRRGQI